MSKAVRILWADEFERYFFLATFGLEEIEQYQSALRLSRSVANEFPAVSGEIFGLQFLAGFETVDPSRLESAARTVIEERFEDASDVGHEWCTIPLDLDLEPKRPGSEYAPRVSFGSVLVTRHGLTGEICLKHADRPIELSTVYWSDFEALFEEG